MKHFLVVTLTLMSFLTFGCSTTQIKAQNANDTITSVKDFKLAIKQVLAVGAEIESKRKVSEASLDKIITPLNDNLADEDLYELKKAYLSERKDWITFEMALRKTQVGELQKVASILQLLGKKETHDRMAKLGGTDVTEDNIKSVAETLSGAKALLRMLQEADLDDSNSSDLDDVSTTITALSELFTLKPVEERNFKREQDFIAETLIDLYGINLALEHDLETIEWRAHFVDAEYQRRLREVSRASIADSRVNLEMVGKF